MCGRYFIPEDDDDSGFDAILGQLSGSALLGEMKRGEIFPTNIAPVVAGPAPTLMKWGFASPSGKGQIINARLETADEKPMFRRAFSEYRCLVPASYYFEWRKDGSRKRKYAIGQKAPIYMAGLYRPEDASSPPLFVILTRPASDGLAFIHERMPVIVPEDLRFTWLTQGLRVQELLDLSDIDMAYRPA